MAKLTDTASTIITDVAGTQLSDVATVSVNTKLRDIHLLALQVWAEPLVPVPLLQLPVAADVRVDKPVAKWRNSNLDSVLVDWYPLDPAPITARLLNPAISAVRVDRPVVKRDFDQDAVLTAWVAKDSDNYSFVGGLGPFLPPLKIVPQHLIASPAKTSKVTIPILSWWIETDLSPQLRVKLAQGPPLSSVVPSADTDRQDILNSWLPVDFTPIVSGQLNPVFKAVRVDNPIVKRDPDQDTVLISWIPPDPSPILPRLLPQGPPRVDMPPPGSEAIDELAAGGTWPALPDPAPILPRYLPVSITAVRVDNPIVKRDPDQDAIFVSWLPPDPLPQLGQKLLPQQVAASQVPLSYSGLDVALQVWTQLNEQVPLFKSPPVRADVLPYINYARQDVLDNWLPSDPTSILPRYLPVSVTAVRVDNPIVKRDPDQDSVLISWLPPDPTPILPRYLPASITSVRVDTPPPRGASKATSIVATWAPLDAQIFPLPQIVQVAPFISSIDTARQDILNSWLPVDPAPIVARSLNAAFEAVRVDNPIVKRDPDQDAALIAWIPADLSPILPRYLPASVTSVRVDTPISKRALFDTAAWITVDSLPQTRAKLSPQPQQFIVSVDTARQDILNSWLPVDFAPIVSRQLNPVFEAVRVDNPIVKRDPDQDAVLNAWVPVDQVTQPIIKLLPQKAAAFVASIDTARQEILNSWLPTDPAPIVARQLNPVFEAVRVDNPVVKRDPDQDAVLASWAPADAQILLPRFVPQVAAAAAVSVLQPRAQALAVVLSAWEPVYPTIDFSTSSVPLASVDNPPPRGASKAVSIVAAWDIADSVQVSQRRLPQGVVAVVPPILATSAVIQSAWTITDALVIVQRSFVVQSVDNPPRFQRVTQTDVVELWPTVADPLPILPPLAVFGVRVDNPPTISAAETSSFSTIMMAWAPSMFDPWFIAPHTGQGTPPPFVPPPGTAISEQLASPFELASTLRSGLGELSGG